MLETTMIDFHCQSCGAPLPISEGMKICECSYCSSRWPVPDLGGRERLGVLKRASDIRQNYEFDRAMGVYENILSERPQDVEAYWGVILCKYGIVYVTDPLSGSKIPTCHRSSADSILGDPDYRKILEFADEEALPLYKEKAEMLEELRKGILKVSENEPPYDIFICYKEADANRQRTEDSVLAQTIYNMLTEKKYRVFFSRVTLAEHVGQEYEPYIFSALNSAKLMIVVGTNKDYFNAIWVKNEWSRYLKIMAKDRTKRIIPCYKDIDAYEMPDEFMNLQGLDMSKLGWELDLLEGVGKLLKPSSTGVQQAAGGVAETEGSILEYADINRFNGDFDKAISNYENVLRINPKKHAAYWGLFLAQNGYADERQLVNSDNSYAMAYNIMGTTTYEALDEEKARALVENHFGTSLKNAITFAEPKEKKRYNAVITELAQSIVPHSRKIALNNTDKLWKVSRSMEEYEICSAAYKALGENKKAAECDKFIAKTIRTDKRRVRHERRLSIVSKISLFLVIVFALGACGMFWCTINKMSTGEILTEFGNLYIPLMIGAALLGLPMGVFCEINEINPLKSNFVAALGIGIVSTVLYFMVDKSDNLVLALLSFTMISYLVAVIFSLVSLVIAKIIIKISEIGLYG